MEEGRKDDARLGRRRTREIRLKLFVREFVCLGPPSL